MVDITAGFTDGYGFGSFWDNMNQNEMYEHCLAPQHESHGLVAAIQSRDDTDKEIERQVKKYGLDALAPPLHAHDGLAQTAATGVDNEIYQRAIVLKGKGEKADKNSKEKEPTYRLRQHLFHGRKVSTLSKNDDNKPGHAGGGGSSATATGTVGL